MRSETAAAESGPGAAGGRSTLRRHGSRRTVGRRRIGLPAGAMALPAVLLLLTFIFAPLVYTLVLSFMHWNLISPDRRFVGVRNYANLASTPNFLQSIVTTAVYGGLFVAIVVPGGLALAKAVDTKLPGMLLARSLIFLPYVIPLVGSAMAWEWVFNPDHGVLTHIFKLFGAGPPEVFSGRWSSVLAIEVVFIWQYIGFYMLIFLSGLQSLDTSLGEAAAVDGASRRRIFWDVERPQLRPVILFAVVFALVHSFQLFDQIYVLTRGGPGTSTYSLVYFIFTEAFQFFNIGGAAAASVVLIAILSVLSWGVFHFTRERTASSATG